MPAIAETPDPIMIVDAAVGASEVQARSLLDAMFREAGFRILNDETLEHALIEVVLDGYDPEQEVGYEYIDAAEAAVSLTADERRQLVSAKRIFIAESTDLETLRRMASTFLETALAAPDAGTTGRLDTAE